MKYLILFSISILFLKCSQTSNESEAVMNVSVKFDDEKSNAIRNHFDNYMKNDTAALRSLSSPDNKIIKEWHYYDGSQMSDEIALANQ